MGFFAESGRVMIVRIDVSLRYDGYIYVMEGYFILWVFGVWFDSLMAKMICLYFLDAVGEIALKVTRHPQPEIADHRWNRGSVPYYLQWGNDGLQRFIRTQQHAQSQRTAASLSCSMASSVSWHCSSSSRTSSPKASSVTPSARPSSTSPKKRRSPFSVEW